MKYIHTYDTIAEFERDYNDDAASIVVSFDCELGRFTYDREEYVESLEQNAYFWTNGEKTLDTDRRNPVVGNKAYNDDPDGDGIPFEPGDDDEYEEYEITAVQTEEHESAYFEPWVSYVIENGQVNYNKPAVIDFQPLGTFGYADFGITQEIMDHWLDVIDNHEPYENLKITIMGERVTYASHYSDGFYFSSLGGFRAYISSQEDYVRVTYGDGGSK